MSCPFCNHTVYSGSYLPDTFFNNKIFKYITCRSCKVIYLSPFPNDDDFLKIYPPSYQSGVHKEILKDPYQKLEGLRFSYGYHFNLIKKYAQGNSILDYGCGAGNFLLNAKNSGYDCDGVEFNPIHVEILKKEIPTSNFFVTEEFLTGETPTYDIIRLSNVLEHLTNPVHIINTLKKKLKPNGIFLIEGPIETNPNLAFFLRYIYLGIRKRIQNLYLTSHPPTHIFFSNVKNQRKFFKTLDLKELYFKTSESEWPFPNKENAKTFIDKVKFLIACISIFISKLMRDWGNTFIYIGQKP